MHSIFSNLLKQSSFILLSSFSSLSVLLFFSLFVYISMSLVYLSLYLIFPIPFFSTKSLYLLPPSPLPLSSPMPLSPSPPIPPPSNTSERKRELKRGKWVSLSAVSLCHYLPNVYVIATNILFHTCGHCWKLYHD